MKLEVAEDKDAMAARITAILEQKQPIASRLVRLHQYYWLRIWLESGALGKAGNLPVTSEDVNGPCLYRWGTVMLTAGGMRKKKRADRPSFLRETNNLSRHGARAEEVSGAAVEEVPQGVLSRSETELNDGAGVGD